MYLYLTKSQSIHALENPLKGEYVNNMINYSHVENTTRFYNPYTYRNRKQDHYLHDYKYVRKGSRTGRR